MKRASGTAVANFIQDRITCRFDIYKHLLSDNDIPLVNVHVQELDNN